MTNETAKKEAIIMNVDSKYVVITENETKEYKTLKNAEKWAIKAGYEPRLETQAQEEKVPLKTKEKEEKAEIQQNKFEPTEKQLNYAKTVNIEIPSNLTKDEGVKFIGNLPATSEIKKILVGMDLTFKENITLAEAEKLMQHKKEEVKRSLSQPMTEAQQKKLESLNIKYKSDLTKGEAGKMIYEEVRKSYPLATEKQLQQLKKFKIEIREDERKNEAGIKISQKMNEIAIRNFKEPANRKLILSEVYQKEAKNMLEKEGYISDEKICKKLLEKGFEAKSISNTLYEKSPNIGKNRNKAFKVVEKINTPELQKTLKKSYER